MNFATFLRLLSKIATLMYPADTPFLSLTQLLEQNIFPLYNDINSVSFSMQQQQEELEKDEVVEQLFKSVGTILAEIFRIYFPWESAGNNEKIDAIVKKSERGFFIFFRDYEISPALLTKSSAFGIWHKIKSRALS